MSSSQAGALITQAHAEGLLSTAGLQNLTAVDLGISIQAGLGLSVDNVQASEVVLVSLLIDDSSSIASAHNTQAVCDGHNLVLDA
jgi:pyridoxine 5'-phosphate synthase PdxJ